MPAVAANDKVSDHRATTVARVLRIKEMKKTAPNGRRKAADHVAGAARAVRLGAMDAAEKVPLIQSLVHLDDGLRVRDVRETKS